MTNSTAKLPTGTTAMVTVLSVVQQCELIEANENCDAAADTPPGQMTWMPCDNLQRRVGGAAPA